MEYKEVNVVLESIEIGTFTTVMGREYGSNDFQNENGTCDQNNPKEILLTFYAPGSIIKYKKLLEIDSDGVKEILQYFVEKISKIEKIKCTVFLDKDRIYDAYKVYKWEIDERPDKKEPW